jgi:hypothetical protein
VILTKAPLPFLLFFLSKPPQLSTKGQLELEQVKWEMPIWQLWRNSNKVAFHKAFWLVMESLLDELDFLG